MYEVYEIDYNHKLHTFLFGSITKEELQSYISFVKSYPYGKPVDKKHIERKKKLQFEHNMNGVINPKIDSKKQRRVQIYININNLPDEYKTVTGKLVRGVKIKENYNSPKRKRKKKIKMN